MNLRYVILNMKNGFGKEFDFANEFNFETRFINNYISKEIRKYKFVTDGTFNLLSIVPSLPSLPSLNEIKNVGAKALEVRVPFDHIKYKSLNDNDKILHNLKLLEKGYNTVDENFNIPLNNLLNIHDKFKNLGFKNEWVHKKVRFKEIGLYIILECTFTMNNFTLYMKMFDINTGEELISGVVLKTYPDEVFFDKLFKDLILEKDKLVITDSFNQPKFVFSLHEILKGTFSCQALTTGASYIPI